MTRVGVITTFPLMRTFAMSPVESSISSIQFRFAIQSDSIDIVELVESAYRGDTSRAGWTTEADLLDGQRTDIGEISSIIDDPNARLLLATTEQGIVGCILIRREPEGAYVGMVAVAPSLQARGIGRRLLGEAEIRSATEFGARRWRMTVIEQRTELIAWYVRHGYIVTGRREPFPYGDSRFGIPRREDLRLMVLEKSLAPLHQKM